MKLRTIFFLSLLVFSASSQVNRPRVGVVRFADSSTHLVYGLAGNYLVDKASLGSADAASFSNESGIVSSGGILTLLDQDFWPVATFESDEMHPVLNTDGNNSTAVAWLPATHRVVHWNGKKLVALDVPDFASRGIVTAVRKPNSKSASLLLATPGEGVVEAQVSLEDGHLTTWTLLPESHGSAFAEGSLVLSLQSHRLVISSPGAGMVATLPIAADSITAERAASDCIHLSSASVSKHWMLHTKNGSFELYELPAVAETESAK
jgi:hypothetical protein